MTNLILLLLFKLPLSSQAASFCETAGGKVQTFTNLKICSLGEAKVEEGSLERHVTTKEKQEALRLFLERPMPRNLAGGDAPGQYCDQLGGSSDVVQFKKEEFFLCLFGDGSSIEQWTLFKGPKSADNALLMKALQPPKKKK